MLKLANAINLVLAIVIVTGIGPAPAHAASLLYAPTEADDSGFRSALSALIGGPVDYFDARYSTPSVSMLAQYDAVLTWRDYSYPDPVLLGNRLADYVDLGGKVILGFGCSSSLQGRIMEGGYCPVAAFGSTWEQYAHDGVDCVHDGVTGYDSVPIIALQPGAEADGTLTPSGDPGIAWRADRLVYYGGGNTGGTFGGGDWLHLTANMVLCAPGPRLGDMNCDGALNAFDIDPFVLALTDAAAYAAAWPSCDYMLADINGDGAVNAFDIDPFVDCLTSLECP